MTSTPKLYSIRNGILTINNENINKISDNNNEKIIKYYYNTKITSDQYHTSMIKQYRKQNQLLRKNYGILQKQYYSLLGYCCQQSIKSKINNSKSYTPIRALYQKQIGTNSEDINKNSKTSDSQGNASSLQMDYQYMNNFDGKKDLQTKTVALSQSILQQKQRDEQIEKHSHRRNIKTQTNQTMDDELMNALQQIAHLKAQLSQLKQRYSIKITKLRTEYKQRIQNLQQQLQKQKNKQIVLDETIKKINQQLEQKNQFFQSVQNIQPSFQKQTVLSVIRSFNITI